MACLLTPAWMGCGHYRMSSRRSPGMAALGLLLVLLSACGVPRGDAAAGRRWYVMARCDACHGEEGRGGRGRPPALAALSLSHARFAAKVRRAGEGIMPSTAPDVLSDQQLADMYVYLRGLPPAGQAR